MSKNKNKGSNRNKSIGTIKENPNSSDPLDGKVEELIVKLRQFDQSYLEVSLQKHFEDQTQDLYPNLARETISVPAIHVNKCKTKSNTALGYKTLEPPQDSDARGDKAHVIIFHALFDLSEQLKIRGWMPLFIINSYQYDSYLSRLKSRWQKGSTSAVELGNAQSPEPAPVEETGGDLPLPLPKESGVKRGEVDMLVLQPGRVTFIQAKSMGDNFHKWTEQKLQKKDESIMKEVCDAFGQLDKDHTVFQYCMSTFYDEFTVVKVAAFPNLTWQQIEEANEKVPSVLLEVGYSLDFKQHKLLCKENLLIVDDDNCQEQAAMPLVTWWEKHVEDVTENFAPGPEARVSQMDGCECDELPVEGIKTLKIVVGRFLGIMSVVSINCRTAAKGSYVCRRLGQSVKFVSDSFSSITLTHEQVDMVNNHVRLGFLSGPPGSGKTVVLAIKARSWIIQEHNYVVVINMYRGAPGRAIGKQTINTIRMHPNKDRQTKLEKNCFELCVDVNTFDSKKREEAVEDILKHFGLELSDHQRLMFLVDETYVMSYWNKVYNMLAEDFKKSHIWLAGLYGNMPDRFTLMKLGKVMRCPPMIQGLLQQVDWIDDRVKCYETGPKTSEETDNTPTTGTYVLAIRHRNHSEPSSAITQCRECGEYIAQLLEQKFNVCKPGASDSQPEDLKKNSLSCRDICFLINLPRRLYRSDRYNNIDTTKKRYEAYMKSLEGCPMFDALKQNGYPVKLHIELPCRDLVADAKSEVDVPDTIKACWVFSFQGLENPVVFYLPGDPPMPENLDALSPEERAVWTDPQKNIPCPGYSTTYNGDNASSTVESPRLIPNTGGRQQGEQDDRDQRYKKEDVDRFSRWDKSVLFISASRCTSQLVLITP